MLTPRTPTEKFPLVVRKSVRDEWDNRKAELEEKFSKLLGVSWTFEVNPNFIHAYSDGQGYSHEHLGACIYNYFEWAHGVLTNFLDHDGHGPEGKKELNDLASKHILTLEPDLKNTVYCCGCEVDDGYLRMLFREDRLGFNSGDALRELDVALRNASAGAAPDTLTYHARHSIKKYWDPFNEEIRKKIADQLHNPDIKLTPSFETNFLALKAGGEETSQDFEKNLGNYTRAYFESFAGNLEINKFKDDDMLYEGFADAVPKGEIVFRVVDKLTGDNRYGQILLEDGKFVIQTIPKFFGTNTSDIVQGIVDLL